MSHPREALEANVLTTLQGMTVAAGYDLPKDLRLVTRQILDYDETAGQRPACIIQFPDLRTELNGLGGIEQGTLNGRLIFYFDLETAPWLPVTWANKFIAAARTVLVLDESRGGLAYH